MPAPNTFSLRRILFFGIRLIPIKLPLSSRPCDRRSTCGVLVLGCLFGLFVGAGMQGCSCGIGLVSDPSSQTGTGVQGTNKQTETSGSSATSTPPVSRDTQTTTPSNPPNPSAAPRPSRYQVCGVAMVAFYPGVTPQSAPRIDPAVGSMNGYVVITDQPQETVISAWALKDGECQFESSSYAQPEPPTRIRGLNAGTGLSVQVGDKKLMLERRQNPLSWTSELDNIYNIPTTADYAFPYQQNVVFQSAGSPEVKAFRFELQAPAQVRILQPELTTDGISWPRQQDASLRWQTNNAEYLAIRINQNLRDTKQIRSLFCRFANTGSATIPAAQLQQLAADTEGASSYFYILSTTYKLSPLPGFSEPVLTVARATTTVPIKLP